MEKEFIPWPVIAACIGAGVLLALLGIPLWLRRVPPNWFYGVRFPSTLADESVWYDINARGGRDLVVLGAFYLVLLIGALTLGSSWNIALRVLVPVGVLVGGLMVESIVLGIAASRLLAQRRAQR